jgi:sensor histidine kinase YesM
LWRSIGVHTVSAVVFAATFLCAASYLRYRLFLEARPDLTWRLTALRYYSVYFNTFFLNYWAIVAVYSAFLRQERRRETLMLEKQLTNARLAALQAQIRPHFLFNTLNAISALARAGETRTVIRMLAGLADLLRAAFGESGSAVIPLREELKLVRQYLDLEKLRFPDRFNVSVRAEAAALDAGVPRFLLQPVVENAVRHGIAASAGVGSIAIDARLRDGLVEVQVRDSGPGPRGGASGGTGLNNTRDRLAELYAGRASLELAAAPGGGALVTLRLPHSAAVVGAAT